MKRVLAFSIFFICLTPSFSATSSKLFPVDPFLRERVDFWKKVYTEISNKFGYIHDQNHPSLIYETISVKKMSRKKRIRFVKKRKRQVKSLIKSIINKKNKKIKLNKKEEKIFLKISHLSRPEQKKLARGVRFQRGMSNRYLEGLSKSFMYLGQIKEVFRKKDLPETLAYLPHVESSFNYRAYSKVGAAGIWQFMRGTARMYGLKINYAVDERRDPLKSAKAAANLLRDNYKNLGTWPLALTAYNHGPVSIKRAIKKVGSTDISKIIQEYKGRRFGFASKNFYATFMATVEISENPERYFKGFKKYSAQTYSEIKIKKSLPLKSILKVVKASKKEIKKLNPKLRPVALRGHILLPKNITLKIPTTPNEEIKKYLAKLKKLKPVSLKRGQGFSHIVSKGENLYLISKMYNISLRKIVMTNREVIPSRILPGTKIFIPGVKSIKKTNIVVSKQKRKISNEKNGTLDKKTLINSKYIETQPAQIETEDIKDHQLDVTKLKNNLYTIIVETDETIGHYCDWLNIYASNIKSLNDMGNKSFIKMGQVLKLPIQDNQLTEFNLKRMEFHISIQEDFYNSFKVVATKNYTIRRGDTLADIMRDEQIPYWLFRKHQKGPISKIYNGDKILIPIIESI